MEEIRRRDGSGSKGSWIKCFRASEEIVMSTHVIGEVVVD